MSIPAAGSSVAASGCPAARKAFGFEYIMLCLHHRHSDLLLLLFITLHGPIPPPFLQALSQVTPAAASVPWPRPSSPSPPSDVFFASLQSFPARASKPGPLGHCRKDTLVALVHLHLENISLVLPMVDHSGPWQRICFCKGSSFLLPRNRRESFGAEIFSVPLESPGEWWKSMHPVH